MNFEWTAESVDRLRQMWRDGLSASECAARLGSPTRSAVLGKVHRLNLPGRKTAVRKRHETKRDVAKRVAKARATRAAKPKRAPGQFNASRPTPSELAVSAAEWQALQEQVAARQDVIRVASIIDLEDNQCRWPIGEPTRGYCGDVKVPGKSYCACHLARATARDSWHVRWIDAGRPSWAAPTIEEPVAA